MNTIYYDIFETETHHEYHVSAVRAEVVDRASMSRKIAKTCSAEEIAEARERWLAEVDLYSSVRVADYTKVRQAGGTLFVSESDRAKAYTVEMFNNLSDPILDERGTEIFESCILNKGLSFLDGNEPA